MPEQIALALIDGKISQIPASDTIRSASAGSSFQKYFIASGESYVIPEFCSSVITGPLEIEGVLEVCGRLEVL
jgi:hypothetical protein